MKTLRIGTRGSKLALWQANTVVRLIAELGGPACEVVVIRTSGDESAGPPDAPNTTSESPPNPYVARAGRGPQRADFARWGGFRPAMKATFVKEIEDALLDSRVDLAVHSSKDLSALLPAGLAIGSALAREDARDAVLLPNGESVPSFDALTERLGSQPRFGTSSVRRAAQHGALFPRAAFVPIRGNVDTRLRKLDAGECDVLVLACAGLKRLGLEARISLALPVDACIPAPGQGIVAVQAREDRDDLRDVLRGISDQAAFDALRAERAVVSALGGGCQMPLGAYARIEGADLVIDAIVVAPDGSRSVRADARGARADAATVGQAVAASLLERGAREVLGA
jgi:hydroxymethylbilane synthase